MLKKIVVGTLFVGMVAVLVAGAIIRTQDRLQASNERSGRDESEHEDAESAAYAAIAWAALEGQAASVDDDALVIALADGTQLIVDGSPWLYARDKGFAPAVGDQLALTVFEEDGETKPGHITNLTSGQDIVLRLESGQPMWSGGAGGGKGAGGGGGSGASQDGDNPGGEAVGHDDWLVYSGTVASVDGSALSLLTGDGYTLLVEGRAWSYAQEKGFSAQVGDQITLRGIYENDEFKPAQIDDLTSGQSIAVRDENGAPMWSGRGRN